jgi:sugar phosphate isomerase/epimerase
MANTKGTPKRGVSIYSYSGLYGVCMTLEDCFKDMYDMGATCVEILSSHIENYPHPTTRWLDNWFRLLDKYKIEPGGYGHWGETILYKNRKMTTEEAVNNLVRDFRLAHLLGFKYLRTKLTIVDGEEYGTLESGWQEYVGRALEYAEKYDVYMCSEIHKPTTFRAANVAELLEFIQKSGSKHFGFNVDFGTFQNKFPKEAMLDVVAVTGKDPVKDGFAPPPSGGDYSTPEEMIPFLPYVYYCHAKFNYMDENFEEITIPYKEVLNVLVDHGWSSYVVSEYEGPHKEDPDFVPEQLRRQHIMMKRILGY